MHLRNLKRQQILSSFLLTFNHSKVHMTTSTSLRALSVHVRMREFELERGGAML